MERQRTLSITNTKRCLFPEDDTSCRRSAHSPLMKGSKSHDASPTAVQAYPMYDSRNNTSIKSRIAMGDHGAEVLVDMSLPSINTPEKDQVFTRTHSLLDTRSSPAFRRDDSFVFHVVEDSPFGNCYRNANHSPFGLQTSIALCLGDAEEDFPSAAGCNGWQAWSYFSSDEEKNQSPNNSPPMDRLTNRAISQEAKKIRVKHIRRELNPFNKSPRTPKEFTKSQSFTIANQVPFGRKQRISHKQSPVKQEARPARGLTDVIQMCTMPENATTSSPMIIRRNQHYEYDGKELDEFYDSDPEDFTRTRRRTPQKRKDRSDVYQRGVSRAPTGQFDDIYDDEAFSTIAQGFINSTSTLIFHSKTDSKESSPLVVNAWVERGQDFGQSLIQPKWMWQSESGESRARKIMHQVNAIDLLSVTRILNVDQIDRSHYPFAKPLSCFLIRTVSGDDYFFEAESQSERDYMVHSMKMAIARFGAMVLNQDEGIHEEFFATSEPVPGAIPEVLTRTSI